MYSVIPENFFMPLAAPGRRVYWDCIYRLFSIMDKQLSFGVERDILVDEIQYYFEQTQAAEMDDPEFIEADSRGKANAMLRRLERYGWIEIETDKSYVQRAVFHDYAVKLIKTLLEIKDGVKVEYQGYIYVIYNLVRSESDNPGTILLQIRDNTDLLITGLKNLNSSIKHYIDELTSRVTVSQIMDTLFNDYITNIVDKAYHRLLTSDNVSKYRPEIIERLEAASRDSGFIKSASDELAELQEIGVEEAEEHVYQYLHEIIEAFRNMDDILDEINRKNTQYLRSAVNRAKFILNDSEDVRGQIKEIISEINSEMDRKGLDPGGIYELGFLDGLIKLYSSSFMDERSFYAPVEGRRRFSPDPIEAAEPDEAARREKMRRMAAKMGQILSPKNIDEYVMKCLDGRPSIQASEMPLETPEDFVKLIYVRLYGQRKNMEYVIGYETDEPAAAAGKDGAGYQSAAAPERAETEINGYRFRNFKVRKK